MSTRAERVLEDWTELETKSQKIYDSLSTERANAYFELLHSVVLLMTNLNRMYIAGECDGSAACPRAGQVQG
jgi:hypothetical protein